MEYYNIYKSIKLDLIYQMKMTFVIGYTYVDTKT